MQTKTILAGTTQVQAKTTGGLNESTRCMKKKDLWRREKLKRGPKIRQIGAQFGRLHTRHYKERIPWEATRALVLKGI